jgi:hypothetical protein
MSLTWGRVADRGRQWSPLENQWRAGSCLVRGGLPSRHVRVGRRLYRARAEGPKTSRRVPEPMRYRTHTYSAVKQLRIDTRSASPIAVVNRTNGAGVVALGAGEAVRIRAAVAALTGQQRAVALVAGHVRVLRGVSGRSTRQHGSQTPWAYE